MKRKVDLYKLMVVACFIVYGLVLFQLFTQNLIIDSDYPFHAHTMWAASNNFLVMDPFINGGNYITLIYGAPVILVGALLYPFAGVYTVAILLAVAAPALWYLSKRVFECLTSRKVAKLAAVVVLLNPFTVLLFLTAKLPFLWAVGFALASIFLHLKGKNLFASIVGALAVVTHPLAIFLLGATLLLNHDLKKWLKPFFFPLSITLIQLLILFRPIGWSVGGVSIVNAFLFAVAMGIVLWLKREAWLFCALGLLTFFAAVVTGFLRLPTFPTGYFDRITFLIVLLLIPLAIRKLKYTFIISLLVPMTLGMVYVRASPAIDNPDVYRTLPEPILENLRNGYVRYASDGSALYELPKLGVKFSNSGQEMFEVENLDAAAYVDRIQKENASYILVYGCPPNENIIYGWYLEEKIIQECGFPLVYSVENLRIYAALGQKQTDNGELP